MKRVMLGLVTTALMLAGAREAAAEEPTLNTDQVTIVPDDPPLKRFAVVANPAGLLIGRYSVQGEVMLAQHYALTINPAYTHTTSVLGGSIRGPGGEIGLRAYTGRAGAHGLFIGSSLLGARYRETAPNGQSDSFNAWGAALDVGYQGMVGPGVLIGGGLGVMYLATGRDIPAGPNLNYASAAVASNGFSTRLLFTLGFAF